MSSDVYVSAAVEGLVDEAVVRRLIQHCGATPGPVFGKEGKAALRSRLAGYNNAARRAPWIVLLDLDDDFDCVVSLRQAWMPQAAEYLCFRVAVRAVEAWLLADSRNVAAFLGVARTVVPAGPENLSNPKEALVNLARRSRWRAVRDDIVPRPSSGRAVGPAYAARLIEFVHTDWDPHAASAQATSLLGAIECLQRLARAPASGAQMNR